MGMKLGENLKVTLFGESHGACVGALVEGIPAGTPIDEAELNRAIANRRPGRKGMSARSESDQCEVLSGVYDGKATGWPILMLTRNSDAKPSDYSFLPDQPRPGHADMVESIRSNGSNDPRGGGSQSARLTYGLVTAGSQVKFLLDQAGWHCNAHLHSVGDIVARPLFELEKGAEMKPSSDMVRLNCKDPEAAREMSERIQNLVSVKMDRMPWIGTFHSMGAKIIRNHAKVIGLKSSFTILDKDDQLSLIKQILKSENLDQSKYVPKYIQSRIDQWKNKALNPNDIKADSLGNMSDDKTLSIYKLYQQRLFQINCLDFGDLLLQCINLFKNEDVLKRYSENFKYVLVDEYQDTNTAQYQWLKFLSSASQNICCVGDDDQSIYSWRGAEIDNMLRFEKDFDNTKTTRLEENYRSTNNILKSASSLISYNEARLGKELYSDQGNGDPVYIHLVNSSRDEATFVAQEVMKLRDENPDLNNIAVLVRAVFQSREIEEALIRYSVPYRIIGGIRFYERAEIKDAISYLRIVYENQDDVAFERAIMTPKRGVGEKSFNKIIEVWIIIFTDCLYS